MLNFIGRNRRAERRLSIHLQNVRIEIRVKHDIDAKHIETRHTRLCARVVGNVALSRGVRAVYGDVFNLHCVGSIVHEQ